MLSAEEYLSLVNQRGRAGKPMRRVYGNMLKQRDLFINAYGKLYANKGALTPGVDGQTVDGTSLAKIDALITELAERKFRWTPVRRTYIPKGKGKKGKRPLGLPTWRDKLVEEVIRVILEAYYEPKFSDSSHGYRPGRGCHTALGLIKYWRGTKWFVEVDIRGCFNEIRHDRLIRILLQDFQDESFIKLINGMLKAGYLEDWQYHKTYSGTPQGAIASPILSNIYLHELDKWIENELLKKYNRGNKRARNRERARLVNKAYRTQSDFEIVLEYGAKFRGLYNYYKHAKNVGNVLGHIKWVMEQSPTATLAGKHKTSRKRILKKYGCKEATRAIKVESNERMATFGGFNLLWNKDWKPLNDQQVWIYYGRNETATRLAKDRCEIPDCENKSVEMHHIKKLATLQKKYKNAKDAPAWVQKMIGRQRKTLAVCKQHHQAIHRGEYDGPSLKRLTR